MVQRDPVDVAETAGKVLGDLHAVAAISECGAHHIGLALATNQPRRLLQIPELQLAELARAATGFEIAVIRVIGSLDPRIARAVRGTAEVARFNGNPANDRRPAERHAVEP